MRDRFWLPALSREARNEQRKLGGNLANAVAITMLVAALLGPYVNPALAATLDLTARLAMAGGALVAHLLARTLVRGMEDK